MISTILISLFFQSSALELDYGARAVFGNMELESSQQAESYFEPEVYGEYRFGDYTALRGSLIGRVSDQKDYLGIQGSVPLFLDIPEIDFISYLAPGYRWLSRGVHAPFLEGGFGIKSLMGVGVGYRLIFNEMIANGFKDEGQFFLFIKFKQSTPQSDSTSKKRTVSSTALKH